MQHGVQPVRLRHRGAGDAVDGAADHGELLLRRGSVGSLGLDGCGSGSPKVKRALHRGGHFGCLLPLLAVSQFQRIQMLVNLLHLLSDAAQLFAYRAALSERARVEGGFLVGLLLSFRAHHLPQTLHFREGALSHLVAGYYLLRGRALLQVHLRHLGVRRLQRLRLLQHRAHLLLREHPHRPAAVLNALHQLLHLLQHLRHVPHLLGEARMQPLEAACVRRHGARRLAHVLLTRAPLLPTRQRGLGRQPGGATVSFRRFGRTPQARGGCFCWGGSLRHSRAAWALLPGRRDDVLAPHIRSALRRRALLRKRAGQHRLQLLLEVFLQLGFRHLASLLSLHNHLRQLSAQSLRRVLDDVYGGRRRSTRISRNGHGCWCWGWCWCKLLASNGGHRHRKTRTGTVAGSRLGREWGRWDAHLGRRREWTRCTACGSCWNCGSCFRGRLWGGKGDLLGRRRWLGLLGLGWGRSWQWLRRRNHVAWVSLPVAARHSEGS
mmetsp:Transcript_18192/g.34634  ORF Transcript_18192/g.34634 Transcript_18192/m.34634 type:complete len:492 (+) Transcript_18192:1979-3454(+)